MPETINATEGHANTVPGAWTTEHLSITVPGASGSEPELRTVAVRVFTPEPEVRTITVPVSTYQRPDESTEAGEPQASDSAAVLATPEPVTTNEPERSSPWLTAAEAGKYAGVGRRLIYREVRAGRLRAAVLGHRRDLRIHRDWVDGWLTASASDSPTGRASR